MKRRLIETRLKHDERIASFISCPTALEAKNNQDNEKKNFVGLAFWISFDWPNHAVSAFENHIIGLIVKEGGNILSCKVVKSRGI